MRDALEEQEAFLTTRFNNAVLETGGKAASETSSVMDVITEKATKLDQNISDLYSLARNQAPGVKNIRFDKLTETLKRLAPSDFRAGGNVKAFVGEMQSRGILDKNMKLVGRVDVETSEELRKLANELYDPQNAYGNGLLRVIKDALDDDVFRVSGKDYFKQARKAKSDFEKGLSRAKISKFDNRNKNLVRDILENKIDPDSLTDKVVFGKSWRAQDVDQLKSYLLQDEAGKSAFDDLRAETMQKIMDKSFIGSIDEAGYQALSRDKLQKSLSSIGRNKMNVLFSPKEQKFLKDMLELAKLREPVRGTVLGKGPSAQAVASLEKRLSDIPILGGIYGLLNIDATGRMALRAKPAKIKDVNRISPAPIAAAATVPVVAQGAENE